MNHKRISQSLAVGVASLLLLGATGCQTTKTVKSESWVDETTSGTAGQSTVVTAQSGTAAAGGTNGTNGTDGTGAAGTKSGLIGANGGVSAKSTIDLKGATVTLAGWDTGIMPKASDPAYAQETALVTNIEKKYNCVLKGKTIADWGAFKSAFVTATMSGVKFADIMLEASEWVYPSQITSGYLTALDKYVDCSSIAFSKGNIEKLKVNGKHYCLVPSDNLQIPTGIWFNKSIFNKFGVQTPDKYVGTNNWTWDTFVQVCKSLTRQSGGVQYYGWGMPKINPAGPWITSNGGLPVTVQNGKRVFSLGSSQAVAGIQFASDLYHTYNVCPDPDSSDSLFNKGQVAMTAADYWGGPDVMKNLGSGNVGFTYVPRGKNVKGYTFADQSIGVYVIPSTVKNPAAIASVLVDYIYPYTWRPSAENRYAADFGDQTSLETAIAMGRATANDPNTNTYYDYITAKVWWSDFGIFSNKSPQAFVASVQAQAQAELDKVWKNVS